MQKLFHETDFTDHQLFQHDTTNRDLVDTLRPVTYIKTGHSFFDGAIDGTKVTISDADYQEMADERQAEIDGQPRFGEGFLGMAEHCQVRKPVRKIYSDGSSYIESFNDGGMSQLDRMIFEDCYNGGNGVQRPSQNVPQVTKHHRAEWVLQRISTIFEDADIYDAEVLITAWDTIEATPSMIETFISGFGKASLDDTIQYFVDLAGELDFANQIRDREEDARPGREEAPAFTNRVPWVGTDYQVWVDRADTASAVSSEDYRYIQIGNDLGRDNWMRQQPRWFENAIKQIKATTSYVKIKEIGSAQHDRQKQGRLTAAQAKVLWDCHRRKKHQLKVALQHDNPHVPELMDRVLAAADDKVRYAGFWMCDQQAGGRETGLCEKAATITRDGWSLIKEAYFARKTLLIATEEALLAGE